MYKPEPVDTGSVVLPDEVMRLAELLARNTHENFVSMRLAEGWSYGPERSDRLKTNPTLVPYDELPESEREYDRKTALEALKLICALGFEIVKKPEPSEK